ncbi:MAG: VWA domain-containing protein [Terriglobales bacterium]
MRRSAHPLLAAVFIAWTLLLGRQVLGQQDASREQQKSQSGAKSAPAIAHNQDVFPPQELGKITTRTDLVLVPVVVTKSGKHVPGLQRNAFRVEENGKVRPVSVFQEVNAEKLTVPHKEAKVDGYSNFLPGEDQTWRFTGIVLDMVNTPWMRQAEAKRQLTEFLSRTASREEPMAVFGLNSTGLHQLHPFTTDTKVLLEALQKLKLELSSEETTQPPEVFTDDPSEEQQAADETQLMSDFMQDLSDTVAANYQRMATRTTLLGMQQLAHALDAIPGRKTLIWASAGFPFIIDDPSSFARQGDDMQAAYQEVWRALNSANIAVYPVDLSAMDFSTRSLPSHNTGVSSRQINNVRGTNGLKSALQLPYDKNMQQQFSLHAFADATGGRACITVDELEKCLAEAVDDSRAYYLLGYYLGGDTQAGWRKLKVRVAGEGLRTRYRSGFYVAPKIEDSPEMRRRQLVEALASPVQYTGLRLTARRTQTSPAPSPSQDAGQKRAAEFMLGVMGDTITIDRQKGNAIDLEIVTIAFDSSGKGLGTTVQSIATKLGTEHVEQTRRTGLGIPEKLTLAPGKYEAKFAVRDNASGLLGTVSVPVELK